MAISTTPRTRAELQRIPEDGNRYEVLDGQLFVTPLPGAPHQRAAVVLTTELQNYCRRNAIGDVPAFELALAEVFR